MYILYTYRLSILPGASQYWNVLELPNTGMFNSKLKKDRFWGLVWKKEHRLGTLPTFWSLEFNCSGVLFLLNLAKLIDFCFGVEVSTIKRIQLFLNLRLLSVNRSAALHLVCCNENIGTPWNS